MWKSCVIAAVMAVLLVAGSHVRAGVYHPGLPGPHPEISPQAVKPLPFALFYRDTLEDLLKIGNPQESEIRSKFLKRRDALLAKSGSLTEEDQVNLSGFLIRLGQYQEAISLLTPVATRECRNFMIFANLATAEQHLGQFDRAVNHLEQAQDVWPQNWPNLAAEQLRWFRRAEKYHLLLVRHRGAQARRPGSSQLSLDPLFEGVPVRYVGDNGQYEAGRIAATERAKLPPDALAIVQQLLIWLPDDPLLYWQYGELLNANGDVARAARVLDDCVWRRRLDVPELKQHRQIVTEAARAKSQDSDLSSTEGENPSPPAAGTSWLPDRNKLWAAATIFVLVAVVLIYFQFREIRRRRRTPISRK
jgi:tetratricopeptide (TPR) repeat protein